MTRWPIRFLDRLSVEPTRTSDSDRTTSVQVTFGECQLDRERNELRRRGERVAIQPKALELLFLVVGREGLIVTREEIARTLWADAPPASVDASINNLINKIRAALEDSSEQPRFIESVPRKGYRFIAPSSRAESEVGHSPRWYHAAWLLVLAALAVTLTADFYAFAVATFALGVVLLTVTYPLLRDTTAARASVSLFLITAMAYSLSAPTLWDVAEHVVNMKTLSPATIYPIFTGLKFIPSFILLLASWVLVSLDDDIGFRGRPALRVSYLAIGALFLSMTALGVAVYSGDYRIWATGLPGSRTILVCYLVIFATNVTLWLFGYRFFEKSLIGSYRQLFLMTVIAFLVTAVPATTIEVQYNEINRHYLDKRRGHIYVAANATAIKSLEVLISGALQRQVGPDLLALMNDPDFHETLEHGKFYRQVFDEAFQVFERSIMFGYKVRPRSPGDKPVFTVVRFPEELARTLRFQLVGEEE